jgi:hypothetical protein
MLLFGIFIWNLFGSCDLDLGIFSLGFSRWEFVPGILILII